MPKLRTAIRASLIVLMSFICLTPVATATEKLTRTNIIADELLNALMGKSLKGKVTSAAIVKQEGSGLIVEISFRGYENYANLSFDALVLKKNRPSGKTEIEENSLLGPAGSIRLAVELSGIESGETLESDSLEISVFEKNKRKQQYTFEFEKSWRQSATGQALVGTVRIEPKRKSGAKKTFQFRRTALVAQKANAGVANQAMAARAAPAQTAAPASYIRSTSNDKMCFHKKNDGWANGNPVHVYACSSGKEGWKTWIYESKTGYIRNAENKNKCLSKKRVNWPKSDALQLSDCKGGSVTNRSWTYNKSTNQISARSNPKKCISKKFNDWRNGNPLHLGDCAAGSTANKSWKFDAILPIHSRLVISGIMLPPQIPSSVDTEPQGVGNDKIELLANIEDPEFRDSDFLGIEVYEDKNPDSGVFYYHPLYYSLAWNGTDSKYDMDITYGSGAEEKQVRMGMILSSSHLLQHKQFVSKMLEKQYENFAGDLREIGGEAQVTLPESLSSLFGVSKEDISARPPALNQVVISWKTDPVGQETLVAALTGQLGVSGEVYLYPNGKDSRHYAVPLYANLASRRTFGHIEWNRDDGWLNTTAYPIVMRKMHALKIGNAVSVTTWDLGAKLVPPKTQVEWIPTQVPTNLLQDFQHVWFDYDVRDCSNCDLAAVATILDDIADVTAKILNINVLSPIAACNLGGAVMKLRSRYMNAGQNSSATVDINLNDESQYEQALYYSGETHSGQIAEYQLLGILPSGKPLQSNDWRPIEDLVLYVGPYQFEESFPDDVTCD